MTVKELIAELQKFDSELTVIRSRRRGFGGEPAPVLRRFAFDIDYYTGIAFINIPKNTKHIIL